MAIEASQFHSREIPNQIQSWNVIKLITNHLQRQKNIHDFFLSFSLSRWTNIIVNVYGQWMASCAKNNNYILLVIWDTCCIAQHSILIELNFCFANKAFPHKVLNKQWRKQTWSWNFVAITLHTMIIIFCIEEKKNKRHVATNCRNETHSDELQRRKPDEILHKKFRNLLIILLCWRNYD